jgi:hypothetical protein
MEQWDSSPAEEGGDGGGGDDLRGKVEERGGSKRIHEKARESIQRHADRERARKQFCVRETLLGSGVEHLKTKPGRAGGQGEGNKSPIPFD